MNPHQKSVQYEVMKNKRTAHSEIIEKFKKKVEEIEKENNLHFENNVSLMKIPENLKYFQQFFMICYIRYRYRIHLKPI